MSNLSLATLRLGKDSVEDIKHISTMSPGIVSEGTQITVVCTQVSAEFDVGTIVFLWLGSDNSKGIPTEWKQGFKAVGTVSSIERGDKYNDASTIGVTLKYIFVEAINRLDILQKAPTAYYWCSALPIIGLDDHSNQTVRMIASDGERSDVKAFFYVLNAVRPEFRDDIIQVYPEFQEYFNYTVPDPNIAIENASEEASQKMAEKQLEEIRWKGGQNTLLYGVPGSGKSWTIEHEYCPKGSRVERLVFHPDYTNSDFIGQILPVVDKENDNQVTYEFTPGPFTTILRDAYANPQQQFILIIEELNRGNAPAIFGDVFQLLDRMVGEKTIDGIRYHVGTSEYEITNKNIAEKVYGDGTHKIRIPSNLSILATMNTSDQNVFTLDTAFQRRWNMRLIENSFENVRPSLANCLILDTEVSWRRFCETINKQIVGNKAKMASSEDKRLGVYFVHESDLRYDDADIPVNHDTIRAELIDLLKAERDGSITDEQETRLRAIRVALVQNRIFPEKVIKYLWDDAFKFNPGAIFDIEENKELDSLEAVIRLFVYEKRLKERFRVFKSQIRDLLYEP